MSCQKRVYCERCLEDPVVRAIAFTMGWVEEPRTGEWFCPQCAKVVMPSDASSETCPSKRP